MPEIGLWIHTAQDEVFLIRKDVQGYPCLMRMRDGTLISVSDRQEIKQLATSLYAQVTGIPYPHAHAATRQMLWDLLEAAVKQLP